MEEKFNVKMFAGTDYRALDIRFLIAGAGFLPLFAAGAVTAILLGTEVIASDQPIPMMLLILFVSCLALAIALYFLIWYFKAYKTSKFVFYNSVEAEAVPLNVIKEEFNSPPKGCVYGITYALAARPKDLFLDWYRVKCGEDDEDADIFHVLNKTNKILVKNISIADMYRYNGYGYARYTASYPFRKQSEIDVLLNMHRFKVKINTDKGIALYYKPQYAGLDGAENNHL